MDTKVEQGILTNSDSKVAPEEPLEKININGIPNELLMKVFSYLRPREQVKIREVCTQWNGVVIHLCDLPSHVRITVLGSTDVLETMLASNVPWKYIRVVGASIMPENMFCTYLHEIDKPIPYGSFKYLTIHKAVMAWPWLHRIRAKFPYVELGIWNTQKILEEERDPLANRSYRQTMKVFVPWERELEQDEEL